LPNPDKIPEFLKSAEKELHFTVDTEEIVYINAILDSYEGLGIMRTVDREAGHVAIYTAAEKELNKLLESLSNDEGVRITPVLPHGLTGSADVPSTE
jgi:hypothetical protein